MSERDPQHVVVPSQPATQLVMVETDLAFCFFEYRFNRPSHSANTDQLMQRDLSRSIAEVVFDDGRVIQIAAEDQPEFFCGQVFARLGDAQKSEFIRDRSFAAFFDTA